MTSNIWFTSDLHFGHRGILGFTDRHTVWSTPDDMDEGIIANLNARIKPGDTVYHLGDFTFHRQSKTILNIMRRLNGDWHHLRGNHDRLKPDVLNAFAWQGDYKRIKVDNQAVILFHYPIISWHGIHRETWHLHGHCHGNLDVKCPKCNHRPIARRLDVGIDNHPDGYHPWSWDEVRQHMLNISPEPTLYDHHSR